MSDLARQAALDARFMADCAAALAKWHEAKAQEERP